MDTEPDFSIITPSYNYARYVRECIESVKNQEGVTFEHIIQDAGSTDGTLDILHSYPHLKLYIEKDSGMSEGINRGFRKARGKWEIQRAMKALPYSLNMHIWYGTYLASTALFLRRSTTIEEGFLLDERFHYDMDGEYYARLGRAGKKFVHYNRLLADFRWHGDNMDAELKRQKQHGEDATIKRIYGLSFSKHSCNNIMDGFMREAYRMKKAFLYLTTPWEK